MGFLLLAEHAYKVFSRDNSLSLVLIIYLSSHPTTPKTYGGSSGYYLHPLAALNVSASQPVIFQSGDMKALT